MPVETKAAGIGTDGGRDRPADRATGNVDSPADRATGCMDKLADRATGGMDKLAECAPGGAADIATRQAILQALDLPPAAIPQFLQHIGQFCHAHGGEKHYGDLLKLLARYRDLA